MNKTNQIIAVKTGVIIIPGDRYFPEGVTVTSDGTFFVGSMYRRLHYESAERSRSADWSRSSIRGRTAWSRCSAFGQTRRAKHCGPVLRMPATAG